MAEPGERAWTVEEFFAWQERQTERYELVNGCPLKMMAGAKNAHDDFVVNIIAELARLFRGDRFRVFTGAGSVETYSGQIRRADVGVAAGKREPLGYLAHDPVLLIEVISPDDTATGKREEYQSLKTLAHLAFIETERPLARLWARDERGAWREEHISGLQKTVELDNFGVALDMREIYRDVDFPDPR